MIKASDFISELKKSDLGPFLMVPCSIFKSLNAYFSANSEPVLFPPNEAHAMGYAIGSYTASGNPAVILMQNSGLNNIANCHTSLNALYKIPVILFISWRGEPEGKKDAPEHEIMGKITKKFLALLDIPYEVLSDNWKKELKTMTALAKKEKRPVALVIREGIFEKETAVIDDLSKKYPLSRVDVIKMLKETYNNKSAFISTNGFTSRDSFAVSPTPDFYMMGSMGHAFSIGAGVADSLKNGKSKMKTIVFDGDGGSLMHLGSLAMMGMDSLKKSNLLYVLMDNEAYESTGNQPTLSSGIDFKKLGKAFGFPQIFSVKTKTQLKHALKSIKTNRAALLHIKINRKKGEETARVSDKYTCEQITAMFMETLRKNA